MTSQSKYHKIKSFHKWYRSGKELKNKFKCKGLNFYNSALRQYLKKEITSLREE